MPSDITSLHIGICDDEPLAIDYLTGHLQSWASDKNIHLQLSAFSSAEQFLFEYDENQNFDVLMLDIQMGDMNGMELARKIRSIDSHVQLIFITALTDYLSDGYEVAALHYLLKPVSPEKLFTVMDRAMQQFHKTETYLLAVIDQTTKRIPIKDIICAEAFAHYILITTREETFELRETMSTLADKLGNSFVRPHRSYLVNLRYIHSISKTQILLDNKQTIPLSRYNYQKINQCFIDFYKSNLTF